MVCKRGGTRLVRSPAFCSAHRETTQGVFQERLVRFCRAWAATAGLSTGSEIRRLVYAGFTKARRNAFAASECRDTGKCVARSEERFSTNAETDIVCRP